MTMNHQQTSPSRLGRTVALALAILALTACVHGGMQKTPIQQVSGTPYFTAEGRGPLTSSWDFSRKLAWLSAASALSRARAAEVYARLTLDQRAQLERLLRGTARGRNDVSGLVTFLDQATARSPLREIHELRARSERGMFVVVLGIPLETWRELVDEAAEETRRALQQAPDMAGRRPRP